MLQEVTSSLSEITKIISSPIIFVGSFFSGNKLKVLKELYNSVRKGNYFCLIKPKICIILVELLEF